ncbi:hypothetical protein L210DRAFT_3611970 [Boletus edulis BED1]|uniref:X-box-binding protein 1 n=1 Tax=Boletus edulis BED1 TaxID=1328754 RepID=A0AAD4BWE9_BOLED|nr:hypothetical protein L210DRAFT_3611970 [Boletus edulis BED1]
MTQQCAFVDPSSLSLPSSSLKRPASPAFSTDDSTPCPTDEPPRKRSRSTVTPEERKEARAHRNRIAAQNSRDRRKAQFGYLERRVTELEEENRRLRAGIYVSPPPSISEPDHVTTLEREQEQLRKREEEQRERENQELRERIRTLEKGYEAVVQALAAQGTPSVTSSIPTPPATSPAPTIPSHLQSSQPASNPHTSSPSTPNPASSSSAPSLPLSPTSSNSTLVDSPLLFAGCDSSDFPQSPALPANDVSLALSLESLDLSVATSTPTRHLARVVNTVGRPAVSLQRVGCAQVMMGLASTSSPKTRQHQMQPSRVCSRKSSRRRRLTLALFQALALRQKMLPARRC